MSEPAAPMGRLDAIEVGSRKLTLQTEYFPRPNPRLETKVYIGGALKKVFTEEVTGTEPDLQNRLNSAHQTRLEEIVAGLEGLKPK